MNESMNFEFFTPIPPLTENDSIYAPNSNYMMNACLNFWGDPTGAYINGFFELAEVGIQYVDQNKHSQDTLFYPIAYLYRHHLELIIKDIIISGNRLLNREKHPPRGHHLLHLWRECRAVINDVWPDDPPEELIHVDRILRELSDLDPGGECFRYPRSKDGLPTLPVELYRLNLLSLSTTVRKTSYFLESVNAAIYVYADWQSEVD